MRQLIELKSTEARKAIVKHFGITPANLSQILNYRRNGSNANAVREMALQHGGRKLTEDVIEKPIRILNAKGETEKVLIIK